MKKYIYLLIGLLLSGCNFLDDYSQDLVVVKKVSDLDEVLLGSVYIPNNKVTEMNGGGIAWWLHILDDDVNTVIGRNAIKDMRYMNGQYYGYTTWQLEVGRNYDKSALSGDHGVWNQLYARINGANIILAELDDIPISTDAEIADAWRIRGEAHFLRAQFYLMLVNLYANAYNPSDAETTLGVPLKLTNYVEHDKNKKVQFERTPVAKVYTQIVKDLNEAVDCFDKGSEPKSFYRSGKEAALLLLSRVYLYMQDWEKAREAATAFLELNDKLLNILQMDSVGIAVSESSPEIVFSQGSQVLQNGFAGVGGDFCVTADLYNLYDSLDMRKQVYYAKGNPKDSVALRRKYKRAEDRSYISDIFMLRVPEGYLNLAEAYAMLGDAGQASLWLNRLRQYRIRDYREVTYNKDEIIDQVRAERRKELCLEGHRWFDLRRYAVCQKAPFKKTIEHIYAIYDTDNRSIFQRAERYRLEIDDPAYTFAIPKAVLEFDPEMEDNPRESRKYVEAFEIDFEEPGTE